jgi:hypothetical protein
MLKIIIYMYMYILYFSEADCVLRQNQASITIRSACCSLICCLSEWTTGHCPNASIAGQHVVSLYLCDNIGQHVVYLCDNIGFCENKDVVVVVWLTAFNCLLWVKFFLNLCMFLILYVHLNNAI